MAKVTGKLQVTIPKNLAERLSLRAGDEIEWQEGDGSIRIIPLANSGRTEFADRISLFDAASHRQAARNELRANAATRPSAPGWTREEPYDFDRTA